MKGSDWLLERAFAYCRFMEISLARMGRSDEHRTLKVVDWFMKNAMGAISCRGGSEFNSYFVFKFHRF